MIRLFATSLILSGGIAAASVALPPASTEIHATPAGVLGEWYCGDGLGYNVSITLAADGTYQSSSYGCLGNYGSGEGRWSLDGNVLEIEETSGNMADDVDNARMIIHCGHVMMVFDRWWKFVEEHGASRGMCLHRHSARDRLGHF